MSFFPDAGYIAARAALLDVLESLGPHRDAVILVGAQAIYLHTGPSDEAVSPHTTDADLAINPRALSASPPLETILFNAGFEITRRPGTWSRPGSGVDIDLLVPSTLGGPGRRGARLLGHSPDVARKASGLEAVLVDNAPDVVGSLIHDGGPRFVVRVAGLAALLVAKLFKINDRASARDRLLNKDGLDVLRILRFADADRIGSRLELLASDPISGTSTHIARNLLVSQFSRPRGSGVMLAVSALEGLEHPDVTMQSCVLLAGRLLEVWPG